VTPPRTFARGERRQFLRYTRTDRWPLLERFPVPAVVHTDLLAAMLACEPDRIETIVGDLEDETSRAVSEMMAEAGFRAAVEALPFHDDDRVVGLGDSITADRTGWFEMLAASIEFAGTSRAELHNLGVSGNTTADVLERYDLIEAARPSHVLLMLGTNDVRAHGRTGGYRMVTSHETERNLRALIDLITGDLGASITLITPPPVDQHRIDGFFTASPVRWDATTVDEIAAVVRKLDPDCVDLHTAFGTAGSGDLLEADGVHPTVPGQRFILRTIVNRLAR
jgi:lysophospholipase L1-like esterase